MRLYQNKTKRISSYLLLLFLLCTHALKAQYHISGRILNERAEPLAGATIALTAHDTLVAGAVCDEDGFFLLNEIQAGNYIYEISMLGFQSIRKELAVAKHLALGTIILKEEEEMLDEVIINADRRNLIQRNAGSSTFRLSTHALAARNVYEALREIPLLMVNETEHMIKTTDGKTPLILINGIQRAGYIHTLNPEDIESVEVIDNPSARYQGQEEVSAVINIKIKPKQTQFYTNGELFSRHHAGGTYGVSGISTEIGNRNYAFYLNSQHFYFHNDDATTIDQYATQTLSRNTEGNRRYRAQDLSVSTGGDWQINKRNYMALNITLGTNPQITRTEAEGFISDRHVKTDMNLSQQIDNRSWDNGYQLFYRHYFNEENYLDLSTSFGYTRSSASGIRQEVSGTQQDTTLTDLENKMRDWGLELNYSFPVADLSTLDIGANIRYSKSRIEDNLSPQSPFVYTDWAEYLYASLRNKSPKKLSYMLSLGMDLVETNAADAKRHYINFVPSVSLNYTLNKRSSLTFDFQRGRKSPDISQLNPRNVSLDTLRIRVGNPYLKPSFNHLFALGYIWNYDNIYLNPYFSYNYKTDLIEETGEVTKDNVYAYTYQNLGHGHVFNLGLRSRFNLSNLGNLNLSAYYAKTAFPGSRFNGNALNLNSSLSLYYKKVSLFLYVYYTSATYSPVSKMTAAPDSECTFSWDLPKNWRLQAGLRYFASKRSQYTTTTINEDYSSYLRTKMKDRYLMPMIGISYSFRNKSKYQPQQKPRVKYKERNSNTIKIVE